MFLAEFKRRYEKELNAGNITNPLSPGFLNPRMNTPAYQRGKIRSNLYQINDEGKLVSTGGGKKSKYTQNLRTILGGTQGQDGLLTANKILTNNQTGGLKKHYIQQSRAKSGFNNLLSDNAIKTRQSWRNTPDPWTTPRSPSSPTISPSFFQPKQPLALPPSRNNPTVTSTQIPRQNIGRTTNSAQTMPPLKRTTSASKTPHTPIKAGGMNKMLLGGVAAGAGLLGMGAYGLYRQNRAKNKNKR